MEHLFLGECAAWGDWGTWESCSVSCGGGYKIRDRECEGIGECTDGFPKQKGVCGLANCEVYGFWSEWSSCSATCVAQGGEKPTQKRNRNCLVKQKCRPVDLFERKTCPDLAPCSTWSDWTDWTECSATCGEGHSERERECLYGDDCVGGSVEHKDCKQAECPFWANWLEWSSCSSSCGQGQITRSRICVHGTEIDCVGDAIQTESCKIQDCPKWDQWSKWGTCSKSCGTGVTLRSRNCINGQAGTDCIGLGDEERACNTKNCPVWAEWSLWSSCSASCGGGRKSRLRKCRGRGKNRYQI